MQPYQLFRQATLQFIEEKESERKEIDQQIPHVQLISSDGTEFIVPLESALQSQTLSDLISGLGEEKTTKTISLREIDSKTLEIITQVMWSAHHHDDLKRKPFIDAISKDIKLNDNQIIPSLFACNFLEFSPGIKLIAQHISKKPQLIAQISELVQKQQISDNTTKQIAKIYFLMTCKNLPGFDKKLLSFSLCDYLDYYPKLKGLSSRQIDDLNGLPEATFQGLSRLNLSNNKLAELPATTLENLSSLEQLSLNNNQLTEITGKPFQSLRNLRMLYLYRNQIAQLPDSIFQNLWNLEILDLNNNQLTQLPSTLFENLTKLRVLQLDNNGLIQLPETIFQNLTNLKALHLNDNQLTQLPPMLFQNLNNLELLYLNNNKLIQLPATLLQNLTNLSSLYLNNNQLTQLPPTLFKDLNDLHWLILENNRLTCINQQEIRRVLPNVNIKF